MTPKITTKSSGARDHFGRPCARTSLVEEDVMSE